MRRMSYLLAELINHSKISDRPIEKIIREKQSLSHELAYEVVVSRYYL
jgi:hypothetical protein